MTNQYSRPATSAGRAGNAALLIAGMIMLFFATSVVLITGPASWQYWDSSTIGSFVLFYLVWYGIAGMLMFFWWKTRPEEM